MKQIGGAEYVGVKDEDLPSDLRAAMGAWGSRRAALQVVGTTEAPPFPSAWGEAHVTISAVGGRAVAAPRAEWSPCRHCHGSGALFSAQEYSGLTYQVAADCRCRALAARVEAYNLAELPAKAVGCTLDALEWSRLNQSWALITRDERHGRAPSLRHAIFGFVDGWAPGRRGLLFEGRTGLGKTHAAYGITEAITLRFGTRALFVVWSDLIEALKDSFDKRPEGVRETREAAAKTASAAALVHRLVNAPLLVVDELGGEDGTVWSAGVFERVIRRRIDAGRTVLITSNLRSDLDKGSPLSLRGRVGDRAFSRLMETCDVATFVGDDYRLRHVARAAAAGGR